ncbi:MAG: efflux RND transporter periplasmic adaptor subunit [Bacteroidia bacterium]|nr:efflux RND transporter periplasmic adaptor subunit [Bacteroidia bacterium]
MISCKGKKTGIFPEKKEIVESVYASATIKANNQYSSISPVSGILLANMVNEGDSVSIGQIIAKIENTNPALNTDNSRLALEQARRNLAGLDEITAQLSTARRQLSLDSANYYRQKELWANNIGTKVQLESRQLAYDASKNQVKALNTRYNQTRSQLSTAMSQAENNYNISSKNSGDFNITSRINGRVFALNYKPGELVGPQKAVALLGNAEKFILELTVDEIDIGRIQLGQKVILGMDAYRDQVFEGKVTKIYPNLDTKSQSFLVEAEFVNGPPTLYPGMSAEASIVIQSKQNALVIPSNYLIDDSKVLTEDGEVPVKIGIRSLDMVEIISGIDEKTKLLKP